MTQGDLFAAPVGIDWPADDGAISAIDWAALPPCAFGQPHDPVTWARGYHCAACERFTAEALARLSAERAQLDHATGARRDDRARRVR